MAKERLQKILAEAGLGSRRSCEVLITQGRVSVDGQVVTELGAKANPHTQDVRCDGERVRVERKVYFLLNKPQGYHCTNRDESGRPQVVDLLRSVHQRLYTVGRLDAATEGLIILTNDGAFAQHVAHPRHGVIKTYHAEVKGSFTGQNKRQLLDGVWVAGAKARAVQVKVLRRGEQRSIVEVALREGRNRIVRRMLAKVGHRVQWLRRVAIGEIHDARLAVGRSRKLSPAEVRGLMAGAIGDRVVK